MPVKASLFYISLLTCLTSLQTSDNEWQSDIQSEILFLMGILVKPCINSNHIDLLQFPSD